MDGDLEPGARRLLLAALADEPGGWQRCALTFLEAQSWRKASRQLAAEPGGGPSGARPPVAQPLWRRREVRRLAGSVVAAAAVLALVFCGGLATGRAWSTSSGEIAGDAARESSQTAVPKTVVTQGDGSTAGHGQEARMLLHVLGFINVQGEDGARHAVPILAAPGLKVDAPRQSATLAVRDRDAGQSDQRLATALSAGTDGEPISLPLAPGQRVSVPADWMNAIAQVQSVY